MQSSQQMHQVMLQQRQDDAACNRQRNAAVLQALRDPKENIVSEMPKSRNPPIGIRCNAKPLDWSGDSNQYGM